VNDCPNPLDPLDCEALASGDEPVLRSAADASYHLAGCAQCAAAVRDAGALLASLETASGAREGSAPAGLSPDFADRVIRIRPFSRRERRDPRLWAGPAGFGALLFAAGAGLLAAPGLAARDQAGLAVALLAPLAGLARAGFRAFADAAQAAPAGWQALADAARGQAVLGFAALLLIAPAGLALARVLARAGDGRRG
jgi:hypothetical protein